MTILQTPAWRTVRGLAITRLLLSKPWAVASHMVLPSWQRFYACQHANDPWPSVLLWMHTGLWALPGPQGRVGIRVLHLL